MAKVKIKDIENSLTGLGPAEALRELYSIKEVHGAVVEKLILKYEKKNAAYQKELERFNEMCRFEAEAYAQGIKYVAGLDEAGRGPLAGPVVAAAVILPENVFIEGLNDSKQISSKQREKLYNTIKEKALAYGVGIVDEKCIDEINILNATKKAMEIAVSQLEPQPEMLLIDAVNLDGISISQKAIVKGDCLSISIAAASIIAKVTRDRMIEEMDEAYPHYGFAKHKGYGTKEHIDAIKKFGICPIHRISYTKNFV